MSNANDVINTLKELRDVLNDIVASFSNTITITAGRYLAYYKGRYYVMCLREEDATKDRVIRLIKRRRVARVAYSLYKSGLNLPRLKPYQLGDPVIVVAARGLIATEAPNGDEVFYGYDWDKAIVFGYDNVWYVTDSEYRESIANALIPCARMPRREITLP